MKLWLLPYVKWEKSLSMPHAYAVTLLKEVVIPKAGWLDSSVAETGNFEGRVTAQEFTIHRVLDYRNSFAPIISGKFHSFHNGTRVEARLTLHPFVTVFCALWFTAVLAGTILAISAGVSKGWSLPLLIPLGMLIFAYLLMTVSFSAEANKGITFLQDVFSAQREQTL